MFLGRTPAYKCWAVETLAQPNRKRRYLSTRSLTVLRVLRLIDAIRCPDSMPAQISTHVGALHGGAAADFADVAIALGVERGEIVALEAGKHIALGILKGAAAGGRGIRGGGGE